MQISMSNSVGRIRRCGAASVDCPERGLRRRRKRFQGAFTILEIMMAILVFGMVLTAIYSTWLAILKGTKVGLEAAASVQRARISMHALQDSLLTAQKFTANLKDYAFLGEKERMSFVARLPASFPGVGRYGDQIVRRVNFYLEEGRDGLSQLVMTQAPVMQWALVEEGDVEPYTIMLAKDVSVFELSYYDTRQQEWSDEWISTNQMPQLVQIILGLGKAGNDASRPQDVASRIISLPSEAVSPDLQIGGPAGRPPPGINPNIPQVQQR